MLFDEGDKNRALNPALAQRYYEMGAQAIDRYMKYNPAAGAAVKGAETSAEEAAKAPYEMVQVQKPDGTTVLVPKSSLMGGQGQPAGGAAGAEAGETVAKLPEYVTKQQEDLWKTHNEIPAQMQERAQTRERFDQIIDLMNHGYETGAFNKAKADAVAALRGIGINVPDTATANPAAFQYFMKEHMQLVMNQVKSMGNRPLVTEIKTFEMGNPSPELQPKANAMMLTEMKGLLNWQDQYSRDFMDWHKQHPGAYDEGEFAQKWLKENPPEKFIAPEALKFAYAGQAIPPKDQMLNGQHYMIPGKGEWIWSKQANNFVRPESKSARELGLQ